jgi:hypothetical protein
MIPVSRPCLRQFIRARRAERPAPGTWCSPAASFRKGRNRFGLPARRRAGRAATIYHVSDLLHQGRTVDVAGPDIAGTVSAWLAELGVDTPLVDELAQAVRAGDWPTAHAISHRLSVGVTVAA